jgi:hypothetical protein
MSSVTEHIGSSPKNLRKIPSTLIIHPGTAAAENHRAAGGRQTLAGIISMQTFKRCLILTMVILLSACADKRPVLYPNAHLKQVGHAAGQADIDACIQYAVDNEAAGNKGEEIAKGTAGGTAVGVRSVRPRAPYWASWAAPRGRRRAAAGRRGGF